MSKPDIFRFHLGLYPSKAAAQHAMSFMPEHAYMPLRVVWRADDGFRQVGWGLVQQGCDYDAYKHNMLMAWKHSMNSISVRKS